MRDEMSNKELDLLRKKKENEMKVNPSEVQLIQTCSNTKDSVASKAG